MQRSKRSCPICEGKQAEILHTQKFALPEGHPLSDGYDVACCDSCGFIYADTSVTQDAYDRFYAQYSKYEDKKTGTGGVENDWDLRRIEETASQITDFLQNPNASIVDVGCANGGLLKSLRDYGYDNVLGIDPSPICVENTRQLGVSAEIGSLFQPPPEVRYDCVVLSHTLEHVQDLKRAAIWIQSAMKDDAWVYIEVPDASRYVDFVDAPFQDFNTEHINHFSLTGLKNYLKLNRFEPLEWGEKIIPASANKPYPAIFGFARKSHQQGRLEKDTQLRSRIQAYILHSREILNRMNARLQAALANSRRVIIWGTGQLAMKLLLETSLGGADIAAFVDSNPINQGKLLRGVKVLPPSALQGMSEPIVISTTLHQQSILGQIREMGLTNTLILLKDEEQE